MTLTNIPQPRRLRANIWSEERNARLSQLAADGLSGAQIARALGEGLSRQAVIGRARRMGIQLHGNKGRHQAAGVRGATKRLRDRSKPHLRPRSGPVVIIEPPLPSDCHPVTLMDRTPQQCTWVIGDTKGPETMQCGAPRVGEGSWCLYHRALGFTSAAPRKAKPNPVSTLSGAWG